jgi:hypothetical protein
MSVIYCVTGKFHLRRRNKGSERECRYSFILSFTSTLGGGGWSTSRPGRFTPGKETRYPLHRRLGGPQNMSGGLRKISPTLGFDPRTVQPLTSCYTDSAVPAHFHYVYYMYYMRKCKSFKLAVCTGVLISP